MTVERAMTREEMLALVEAATSEHNDDERGDDPPTCANCDVTFQVNDEDEMSPMCHGCAHHVAAQLAAAVRELLGVSVAAQLHLAATKGGRNEMSRQWLEANRENDSLRAQLAAMTVARDELAVIAASWEDDCVWDEDSGSGVPRSEDARITALRAVGAKP